MHSTTGLVLAACCLIASIARAAAAQGTPPTTPTSITRTEAVAAALARGARLGVARADTSLAYAGLLVARARPNPALVAGYSKSAPQYHVEAELPLDLPGLRAARIRAAQVGRDAAQYRFAFARAAVALGADTTYTLALAARERLRLSRRNAQDADSLRVIAEKRRDAGDASDLDVELATVNAGQQANAAAADSLAYVSAVLDLQSALGLAADEATLAPADSLAAPPDEPAPAGASLGIGPDVPAGPTLQIAAARASVESARLGALAERRSVWAGPAITAGFETRDPKGDEPGVLPTVGVTIPLPLLNRNRGPIAQADAEHERARAELALAEVENRTEIARERRELAVALEKVRRDRQLLDAAERIAAKSLVAYREGAAALPGALEAQRNARDVLAQYVADLSDAWIAASILRALTLTPDASR
ncbi:outer membrane efflux protein [Gemmatirosa kalamazoonensis]|uniref:Outer membrane efflux protein n=1 Tax=Gemmatirosa kalamazoonensis TaxID=861299 RepID=W0RJA4_9BACT|nr:TolC family protein [Gemmatirosa kalamazoonensis]AHG89498.1 outer membrane efflux protein [Gemmatirosa kalamazoonensis]